MPPERHRRGRRTGLLAILAVAVAWAFVMQASGLGADRELRARARALARHPGDRPLPLGDARQVLLRGPLLLGQGAGAAAAHPASLRDARRRGRAEPFAQGRATTRTCTAPDAGCSGGPPRGNYGNSRARAQQVRAEIEQRDADGLGARPARRGGCPRPCCCCWCGRSRTGSSPGYGTAAAVTLGLATLVMPFATLFFSHVLAAMLAFAAFALLWREREGAATARARRRCRPARRPGRDDRVPARDRGRGRRPLRDLARRRRAARRGLRRRRGRGRDAARRLQPVGVRVAHPLLLRGRRGRAGQLPATPCSASTTAASSASACRASTSPLELLFSPRGLLALSPVLALGGGRHGRCCTGAAAVRRRSRSAAWRSRTWSTTRATGCRSAAARRGRAS